MSSSKLQIFSFESKKKQKNAFFQISKNGRMSFAKLQFLTFDSKKKQKNTKKCIFTDIQKWPNVLSETAFFSKKSTKKRLGGRRLESPQKSHFGPILGTKIGTFEIIFEIIFWSLFWSPFGPLLGSVLGSILAPDGPKKGARCAQEGHEELRRPKKLHCQKP